MISVAHDEKPYVHTEFKKQCNAKVYGYKKEKLEIGDFIVGEYVIERKQINDLFNSVLSTRIFTQLERIRNFCEETGAKGMLIIEGSKPSAKLRKYQKFINVTELMANFVATYNVQVIRTDTLAQTVRFIKELHIYNNKDKSIIRTARAYKRKKSLGDQKKFVLLGFPTIGNKKASDILKRYDTLMDYFNYIIKKEVSPKILNVLTK